MKPRPFGARLPRDHLSRILQIHQPEWGSIDQRCCTDFCAPKHERDSFNLSNLVESGFCSIRCRERRGERVWPLQLQMARTGERGATVAELGWTHVNIWGENGSASWSLTGHPCPRATPRSCSHSFGNVRTLRIHLVVRARPMYGLPTLAYSLDRNPRLSTLAMRLLPSC